METYNSRLNVISLILSAVKNYSTHNESYPSVLFLGPRERSLLTLEIRDTPYLKFTPDLLHDENDRCFSYQGMTIFYLKQDGVFVGHISPDSENINKYIDNKS